MFLGRYQQGAWLPLSVQCRGNLVAVDPTAAPTINIYNPSFTNILGPRSIPPRAPGKLTGLFELEQFLGSEFSAGIYTLLVSYANGGSSYADLFKFEVTAAGHQNGGYTNLYFYERPHANYVVGQLDSDVLEFRKNPAASDG